MSLAEEGGAVIPSPSAASAAAALEDSSASGVIGGAQIFQEGLEEPLAGVVPPSSLLGGGLSLSRAASVRRQSSRTPLTRGSTVLALSSDADMEIRFIGMNRVAVKRGSGTVRGRGQLY